MRVRNAIRRGVCAWIVGLVSAAFADMAHADSLRVEVSGATSSSGYVAVAVYCRKQSWLVAGEWTKADRLAAAPRLSFLFTDLPVGRCAVSVFHDENSNDKFDRNLLGVPTEPFGYSRNVRPLFGPAAFDDCAIEVRGDVSTAITISRA